MDNGSVYAWGRNDDNQLGFDQETVSEIEERGKESNWPGKCCPIPTKVKNIEGIAKISAGTNYAYAIDGTWKPHSWGLGENYVLGNKSDNNLEEPTEILTEFSKENHIVDVLF